MRPALFTTAMFCAAVTAAAQSHEPAAKGGAKPVPVVSRITAAPKPTPAPAAAHGETEAQGGTASTGTPKPTVSGPSRVPSAPRVPTPAPVDHAPAAVAKAPAGKGPVNLATVHGRLTAALAGLHEEPARGRRTAPAPPRYVVTWPAARWRVAWRDDADRVVVSWPK